MLCILSVTLYVYDVCLYQPKFTRNIVQILFTHRLIHFMQYCTHFFRHLSPVFYIHSHEWIRLSQSTYVVNVGFQRCWAHIHLSFKHSTQAGLEFSVNKKNMLAFSSIHPRYIERLICHPCGGNEAFLFCSIMCGPFRATLDEIVCTFPHQTYVVYDRRRSISVSQLCGRR